jgi:hypothetical protein
MTHLHSYPTIYAIGHKQITDLFQGDVLVEEKIDGSQFSMSVDAEGTLSCRSKGQDLIVDHPERMFVKAVETAKELAPLLHPGWVYRGEFLQKSKHNTLAYDRVPGKHIILFDVDTMGETYLSADEKRQEALRLGLESVPAFYTGPVTGVEQLRHFLGNTSTLGGCKIEGVVIKNYARFTPDKKAMMGKYVSEAFKEVHAGEWRKNNPTPTDVSDMLINKYRTPARWQKAIQHLREAGNLDGSPRDIGNLMKETEADVLKECEGEIKEALFAHFWPQIRRGVTGGLPQWYKDELAKGAFES